MAGGSRTWTGSVFVEIVINSLVHEVQLQTGPRNNDATDRTAKIESWTEVKR